jgi:hypothetical protein
MRAVDQWREIERTLPEGWDEARLSFAVEDPSSISDATLVLAPLGPGQSGNELRFRVQRLGTSGAESVRNLLSRLDRKRIWGTLSLVDATAPARAGTEAVETPAAVAHSLVQAWDDLVASLPPDWSDVVCDLEVDSSDFLPRAALLGAPLNPTRIPDRLALRFRAGRGGYGTSAEMTRRCFERMDAERVTGRLAVVTALSEVGNVATQGPVWRVAGRAV